MKLTKKRVVEMVEKALEPDQPADYRMSVVSEGVQKIDGMWYAVVEPSREDVKSYDFSGRLAEAAADLVRQNGEYIQLTTVMSQHAD